MVWNRTAKSCEISCSNGYASNPNGRCGHPHGLSVPFRLGEDAALECLAASSSISISISPISSLSILVLVLLCLLISLLVLLIGPRSCPVRAHPKAA
ncbi:hypothetical protein TheveDRAFT_0188 [Thermanaerovibrio velox DSM 12556]|uniref:Uncharacterized protein n=1 Tax=Thermanaerovibrio velox DSM 12556 TaxID=926567 RepID=H0UNG5_9BACT|nr:hypothetical protein TheveDRAFT_0188 [Thermanaerovibrio velox DSM 12556]